MSATKSYKFVGDSHTWVRLGGLGTEKTKVGHGEVIESDLDPKYFLNNGFRELDENGKDPIAENKAAEKKAAKNATADAPKTAADFTKKQLHTVAERRKIDLGTARNNADILAVITGKLTPEELAEEVAIEFPADEKDAK